MAKSAKSASSRGDRETVTIRGIRNGLLFTLADDKEFSVVLTELEALLRTGRREVTSQTSMSAYVDRGNRVLSDEEEKSIRKLLATYGNLMLAGFDGVPVPEAVRETLPYVFKGPVRSGQCLEHDGDIVIIGDVNPGGSLIAAGDIYVMGHLRGSAHAGASGNRHAVVAATYFEPTQVRIAGVIRRSPEVRTRAAEMEFAYLQEDLMAVDRMSMLPQYRTRVMDSRSKR